MGRSPLTTDELKLEKIVEKIKFSPTVQGIGILKDFWNEAIETVNECVDIKEFHDTYGNFLGYVVDEDSIFNLKK